MSEDGSVLGSLENTVGEVGQFFGDVNAEIGDKGSEYLHSAEAGYDALTGDMVDADERGRESNNDLVHADADSIRQGEDLDYAEHDLVGTPGPDEAQINEQEAELTQRYAPPDANTELYNYLNSPDQ